MSSLRRIIFTQVTSSHFGTTRSRRIIIRTCHISETLLEREVEERVCAGKSGCKMSQTVNLTGRSIFKGVVPEDLDLSQAANFSELVEFC